MHPKKDDYDWVFIFLTKYFFNYIWHLMTVFISAFFSWGFLSWWNVGLQSARRRQNRGIYVNSHHLLSLFPSFWFAWLVASLGSAALLHSSFWPPESRPEERGVEFRPPFAPVFFASCFHNKCIHYCNLGNARHCRCSTAFTCGFVNEWKQNEKNEVIAAIESARQGHRDVLSAWE